MKQIWIAFFYFCITLFPFSGQATPVQPINQLIQWELNDTSPFTDQKGYTPWQSFKGGKARFVSCSAGVPQNGVLLTGLQIVPDTNVSLQKPKITTDFDAKETQILYPLQNPFAANTAAPYANDVLFFPIVFHLKETTQTIQIPLQTTLFLTTDTETYAQSLSFTLPLAPDTTLSTPVCAALMNTLQRVPEPAKNHLTGTLHKINDQTFSLTLSFTFTPTRVFAQLDGNTPLTLTQIRLQNKTAFLMFHSPVPLENNPPLTFNIITDKGWFRLPISEWSTTPPHSLHHPTISLTTFLILIFFSPFWITLLYLPPKRLRKTSLLLLGTGIPAFYLCIGLFLKYLPAFLIYPTILQYLLALLLLIFFLKTAQKTFLSLPILLLLITPFPFLIDDWLAVFQSPPSTQHLFVLLAGIALSGPLILAFIKPVFFQRFSLFKESLFPRLPLGFLTLWLFFILCITPLNNRLPLYQKPAETGYSLIVYSHPTAFATLWQNLFYFPFNPYETWENKKLLTVRRGHLLNPPAPQNATFPTYILLDSTGDAQLILERPPSHDFLINALKNFIPEPPHPAPDTPTRPLAHSPLHRHAPSPNAM